MNLAFVLFLIGLLGFILNRKNIILMIIALEMMLLASTLLLLLSSFSLDDNTGQLFGIYIVSMAAAESVIGLSLLIAYYRLKGNVNPDPNAGEEQVLITEIKPNDNNLNENSNSNINNNNINSNLNFNPSHNHSSFSNFLTNSNFSDISNLSKEKNK